MIEGIRVPRIAGGRPRTRPDRVLADKAYSSDTEVYKLKHGLEERHGDPVFMVRKMVC